MRKYDHDSRLRSTRRNPSARLADSQFTLLSLMGFVTVCSVLSALASLLGIAASAALMLFALCLWLRLGLAALVMFMVASLAANINISDAAGASIVSTGRQALVILVVIALCGLYLAGRRVTDAIGS